MNTTTKSLEHTVYASNYSRGPEKGNLLYRGAHLPNRISTNSACKYLTYIPSIKRAVLELEICEIGIVGEYLIRNELYTTLNV